MAADVPEEIFDPIFTPPHGPRGLGCGMSLSPDIVVQGHQGQIGVDALAGEFTEIGLTLRRGAQAARSPVDKPS